MTLDRKEVEAALPGYEIGGELGRGGWGIVVEARHRRLGREVAIKQLPRAFAADPSVRSRFVAEARVLASLDHPHIVPVFDYVEADGLCLLVMEKLPGGTVWRRFINDGLTMESSCAVMLATCAGLHAAHQRGILHRDIKPENLMFSGSGVLKVTDFGIAKVLGGTRTRATRVGEVVGTPSYMAPEHAMGMTLGPPADVYAAGVVLFELLSGRLPFSDDGDALAIVYRHVHEAPADLRELAPLVPASIAAVVMQAIAPRPENRYPTAEVFGVALADAAGAAWGPGWASARTDVIVMGSTPIVSAIERSPSSLPVPPGQAYAVAPTVAIRPDAAMASRHRASRAPELNPPATAHEVDVAEGPSAPPHRDRRRRRAAVAGVGMAAVLAAAVAAFFTIGRGDGTTARSPMVTTTTRPNEGGEQTIYAEDFSSRASGWTQFDDDRAQLGYLNGAYRLVLREPEFRLFSDTEFEGAPRREDLLALGDVAVEVDANDVSTARASFGLLCRRSATGEFYTGVVESTGRALIEKFSAGGRETLQEVQTADVVTGRKRLRLECKGGVGTPLSLRLLVDGRLAVEATDAAALGPGRVGVYLASHADGGATVIFDNFVVKTV